jgi:hypothetical protein
MNGELFLWILISGNPRGTANQTLLTRQNSLKIASADQRQIGKITVTIVVATVTLNSFVP